MVKTALTVRDLCVVRGVTAVVRGVSFEAHAGAVMAVIGPNGAGKSTILKTIAGLLPYSGTITVAGADAAALSSRQRARQLAYVPQHSALDAAIPVRDVVAQGRFAHGGALQRRTLTDDRAVDEALGRTDTARLGDRSFNTLSYGERRRVLIARALATGAKLLLLDEPSAALDVGHALALFALLRALAHDGHCVVTVLHQLQEAASHADHTLLLADGRCVAYGPTPDVIAAKPVRDVYGVELIPHAQFGYSPAADDGPRSTKGPAR